jgi:hypothetical protein
LVRQKKPPGFSVQIGRLAAKKMPAGPALI